MNCSNWKSYLYTVIINEAWTVSLAGDSGHGNRGGVSPPNYPSTPHFQAPARDHPLAAQNNLGQAQGPLQGQTAFWSPSPPPRLTSAPAAHRKPKPGYHAANLNLMAHVPRWVIESCWVIGSLNFTWVNWAIGSSWVIKNELGHWVS